MKNAPWPAPPPDAPLPKQPEPPGPRKATLKRYTWVRTHHDLPGKDEWQLVADLAGCTRDRVEAFIWRLEVYANSNRPRGSVEGFPLRALASTWRCEAEQLARIMAALQDPDVGWLEDDAIVTFWERNPDEEDPTGAERARRSRARRRLIKQARSRGAQTAEILQELEAAGLGYPQVQAVTRDTVTVTARAEQTRASDVGENAKSSANAEGEAGPPSAAVDNPDAPPVHRDSGSYESRDEALVWLAFHGKRIVAQRLNEPPPRAQQRLDRWLAQLADDAVALAALIDKADIGSDAVTAQFLQLLSAAIAEHRRREGGQAALPLRPTLAASTGRKAGHG